MRIELFVQARMGSTRLPGKVLLPVLGKPLLEYLIERLQEVKAVIQVVVLTTSQASDDPIVHFCEKKHIPYYRGSEDNVLERYYLAALERRPDVIGRITADCPLIDPDIVELVLQVFLQASPAYDYVSNSLERTYPRGLDVEIFSFSALERAYRQAQHPEEKEHVTVYMYRHPDLFRLRNVAHEPSLADNRWTVDTPEDFELVRLILEHLYPTCPRFRMKDILALLDKHPQWRLLNAHIEQKKLFLYS